MKGHLGFSIKPQLFQPIAYVIDGGGDFVLPAGATKLTAWVVGGGGSWVSDAPYGIDSNPDISPVGASSGAWTRAEWDITGHASDETIFIESSWTYSSAEHPLGASGAILIFRDATLFASKGPSSGYDNWAVNFSASWGWYENTADPDEHNATGGSSNSGIVYKTGSGLSTSFVQKGGAAVAFGNCLTLRPCADLTYANTLDASLPAVVALAGEKVLEDNVPLAPAFGSGAYTSSYSYGGGPRTYLKAGYGGGGTYNGLAGDSAVVLYYT
jgi:hypothetical protein